MALFLCMVLLAPGTFLFTPVPYSAPFFNNQIISVSLSVEEVQTFFSLIAEERIQLDGAIRNKKVFQGSQQ